MKVEKLVVGQLQTNCYLAYDEDSNGGLVIDPGDDPDYIIQKINSLKVKPELIVVTHGHIDHILGVTELRLAYRIPFLLHRADIFLIKKAPRLAKYWLGFRSDPLVGPDDFLRGGERICFGKEGLTVLETPGHTPGSVCLYNQKIIFSGDTLFSDGIGRTDFSYASERDLKKSLAKVFKLSGNLRVLPGHGPETTLRKERKHFEILGTASNL